MSTTALDAPAVQAIAALAQAAIPKHTIELSGITQRPVLLWQDKTITDIEHLLVRPVCKRGTMTAGDAVAFGDYVNAHRTAGLVIFGEVSESEGYFIAILDGHIPAKISVIEGVPPSSQSPAGVPEEIAIENAGAPGWGEHVVNLPLKPTPEWARWLQFNGKPLQQEAFAIFLEENAADVIVPDETVKHVAGFPVPHGQLPNSSQLMSIALTLQTKNDVQFSSKINRQNGQTQLTYHETISATHGAGAEGSLGVPEFFCIAVAPFRGCAAQIVLCRLRFRASGGKAQFEYQIIRPHKIVEHAWKLLSADIVAATRTDVLLGALTLPGRKA